VSVTKGYRAAFASHDAEQSYITVVHFLAHTGGVAPNDLSGAIKTGAFPTALAKTLSTGGAFDSVTVTAIMSWGDVTPPQQDTQAMAIAGALAPGSPDAPRGELGLCRLHSNVAGRGTHGWIYGFPVMQHGYVSTDGKTVVGTYWTQLQAMATALNGVLSVTTVNDTYDLAIFSRARWSRGETNFLFSVTAATASNKLHYLRRRQLR